MGARSSGMFPRVATWVDAETLFTAAAPAKDIPNLQHSAEVHFVAYFSADAVGSVKVTLNNGYEVELAATDERGVDLKVYKVRAGYEIGDMSVGGTQTPAASVDFTGLTAGSAEVSIF